MKKVNIRQDFEFKDVTLINFVNLSYEEKHMIRKWRNNEDIRKWMCSSRMISKKEHNDFIKSLNNDNEMTYWLVKKGLDEYYGVIYLKRICSKNKNAYLGIYVNPRSKVKSKGAFMIQLLIRVSFNRLKLHTLKLEVVEDNLRAIEFYKKNGFVKEGKIKECVFRDREWKDMIMMGIINNKER